jgi:hypothetical protein
VTAPAEMMLLPPPESVDSLPESALPGFLAQLAALQICVASRMQLAQPAGPRAEPDPHLLDAEAVGRILSVPPEYALEMGRRGALPRVLVGKYVRFRRQDVDDWIKRHRDSGVAAPASATNRRRS